MANHYLTAQDILWANRALVPPGQQKFHFAKLEQALAYQYDLKKAGDLATRAAAFGLGLVKNQAFGKANLATGFACMVAFLKLNGYNINVEDGDAKLFEPGQLTQESLRKVMVRSTEEHATPQAALRSTLDAFPRTLKALLKAESGEFVPAHLHIRDVTSAL